MITSGGVPQGPLINMASTARQTRRFGPFELDLDAGEIRRQGRRVKLQPQPFKLLVLMTARPGSLISREEIRAELWPDGTFVDFDQSVNFAVKQIRDALGDAADRPAYIETVPRQGYRFMASLEPAAPPAAAPGPSGTGTVRLQKAMWANIADLHMREARQRRLTHIAIGLLLLILVMLLAFIALR